jgi:hypothetical protein
LSSKSLHLSRIFEALASFSALSPLPSYTTSARPLDSDVTFKVFVIPELLELILEQATIFDILNFYGLCREAKAIFDASSKLQRVITNGTAHTATLNHDRWQAHPLSSSGGIIRAVSHSGDRVDIFFERGQVERFVSCWECMECNADLRTLYEIYSLCRTEHLWCCEAAHGYEIEQGVIGEKIVIASSTGLTLCELHDTSNEIFRADDQYGSTRKLYILFKAKYQCY